MRIDASLVHAFNGKITSEDVYRELFERYKLVNLRVDDDFVEPEICLTIADDYNFGLANFEAYVGRGMDARLFFELRKSAMIPFERSEFYDLHSGCRTCADVRKLRIEYMKRYVREYEDWDWQYNSLIKSLYGEDRTKKWAFNFEWVFKDRDMARQTYTEDYPQDFATYMLGDLAKLLDL